MANIAYIYSLDGGKADWIRIRISTDHGDVINFTVQYETVVAFQQLAVIRYDCAHGFPHVDVLNVRGDLVSKEPLAGTLSMKEALNLAIADIQQHWESYRNRFLGAG